MAKNKIKKVISTIDIPQDMILGDAIITLTGNLSLTIENYKSIMQFTKEIIIVRTKNKRIILKGKNLYIKKYDLYQMEIKGIISEITFVSE